MHIKDFDNWNNIKKSINDIDRPLCSIREVRWCAIGHNIGSEIDGKGESFARPVVILKFLSPNTCLTVPLTHSQKTGEYILEFEFQGEKIKARLDQVKIVDVKRMKKRIGKLSQSDFISLKTKVLNFIS